MRGLGEFASVDYVPFVEKRIFARVGKMPRLLEQAERLALVANGARLQFERVFARTPNVLAMSPGRVM